MTGLELPSRRTLCLEYMDVVVDGEAVTQGQVASSSDPESLETIQISV